MVIIQTGTALKFQLDLDNKTRINIHVKYTCAATAQVLKQSNIQKTDLTVRTQSEHPKALSMHIKVRVKHMCNIT